MISYIINGTEWNNLLLKIEGMITKMSKAIVWTKTYCPYCVNAKNLLQAKGIEYEERNIQEGGWTREQLLEAVPGARTVPQIFIDGKLVGTYEHLKEHFNQIDNKS